MKNLLSIVGLGLTCACVFLAQGNLRAQPANDRCINASAIAIDKGGYAYGVFTSATVDITQATAEPGEFFDFAPSHVKSVWYQFTLPVRRKIKLELSGTNLKDIGLTLYRLSPGCLPGESSLVASVKGDAGGTLEMTSCSPAGVYRVQITAPASASAQVYVQLTLSCRIDPITAPHDCPEEPYVFNNGAPLAPGVVYNVPIHSILCQSIEDTTEYACLPLSNRATYKQSLWYVFRADTSTNLVQLVIDNYLSGPTVGYRLLRGDVRTANPATLEVLACGTAVMDQSANKRRIDLPCTARAGEFNSLVLLFPENYTQNNFNLSLSSRGYVATGWPNVSQPPVLAKNQLGTLTPGQSVVWQDGFDCNALMKNNSCPPAHPASGQVRIYKAPDTLMFDLAAWASFSLSAEATVSFRLNISNLYVRVFRKPPAGGCPSPEADLAFAFLDTTAQTCLAAGDYLVQVLGTVVNAQVKAIYTVQDPWRFGKLGTSFALTIQSRPAPMEKFALRGPADFNAINQLQLLQNKVIYSADSAVIACSNTVLPEDLKCSGATRAIYRQVRVGGGGLLRLINLRTDHPSWKLRYQLFQADASALASAQGAHQAGQKITGMSDYLGFCIDTYQYSDAKPGLDTFCVCVKDASMFTLATLGDSSHVYKGDRPGFQFIPLTTKYSSRAKAETISVQVPGTVQSDTDVFSCEDNVGSFPSCGSYQKAIFRQFYLPSPAVVTITGSGHNMLRLFAGQASDTMVSLTPIGKCVPSGTFYDYCNPLPAGWYTVVSYGYGPNYTNKRAWDGEGDEGSVGRTSTIRIATEEPRRPKYNRPYKAYSAGVTDWQTPPPNNPNAPTRRTYYLGTEWFCEPDTPFIPNFMGSCAAEYNRVAFYTFTITKKSFIVFSDGDIIEDFYTQLFPFNVKKDSHLLKTTPPIYPCVIFDDDFRQICNVPPGEYTLVFFAKDSHFGKSISPQLYVERSEDSRFDDISTAYNFSLIPGDNSWYHGRPGDTHPTLPGQHPSRDVISCATGARATDPSHPCRLLINPLIYSQPGPNPLYLSNTKLTQSARNIWYTFVLDGPGKISININQLSGGLLPIAMLYESPLDAEQPWSAIASLGDPLLSQGLKEIGNNWCAAVCYFLGIPINTDHCNGCSSLSWDKLSCGKKRYFLLLEFDAHTKCGGVVFPNIVVSVSLRFQPVTIPPPLYDERVTANVINGLNQSSPPYASVPISRGQAFSGADLYLPCYTATPTDPPGCATQHTAWYRFEVAESGTLDVALKSKDNQRWVANTSEITLWQEKPDGALEHIPMGMLYLNDDHPWVSGCVGPGKYYLLIRECVLGASAPPDTIKLSEFYQPVIRLNEWPGDFCSNAIFLDVSTYGTYKASMIATCHTIGTDVGEESASRMGCLKGPTGRKTSWFRIRLSAGPKSNLNFSLQEELDANDVLPSDVAYRVYAGTCGALTPLICSADGGNVISQNCLGPGEYFIQVSMPTTAKQLPVAGRITLRLTAQANQEQTCVPFNPSAPQASFDAIIGCEGIVFSNHSTAGTDIAYLWRFPDGTTSTQIEPTWAPPASGTYTFHLEVRNQKNNQTTSTSRTVVFTKPFENYQPLRDTFLCNKLGPVVLDATFPGASYLWSTQATTPKITAQSPGTYTVRLLKNGCEKWDTAVVALIEAQRTVGAILCPEDTIYVGGQAFHRGRSNGVVQLPAAHPSGCDSILTINLQFHPESVKQLDTTLCAGKTFSINGVTFSAQHPQGSVWLPGQGAHGCALRIDVSAQFTPIPRRTERKTLCPGETWVFGGEVFSETRPSDTVWLATTIPGGCDTAVWVQTDYYYPDTARITVQTCEDAYLFEGQVLTPSYPEHTFVYKNAAYAGCDSFVLVQVDFLPKFITHYQPILCPGEEVRVGNEVFNEQRLSGMIILTAENGCDSTVIVQATALSPALGYVTGTYCFNDTVYLFGEAFTRHRSHDTLRRPGVAPHGCDSIWIISLNFRDFAHSLTTQSACLGTTITLAPLTSGKNYRWQDGSTSPTLDIAHSGTYWVETLDDHNCVIQRDSFVLSFYPLSPPQMQTTFVCQNHLATLKAEGSTGFYRWFAVPVGGTSLGVGASWQVGPLSQDTVLWVEAYEPTMVGCVSQRVPAEVKVYPAYNRTIQVVTCESEPYYFAGQWRTASGIYMDTLSSMHGCDSIVVLNLTMHDTFARQVAITLCHDGEYILPDHTVVDEAGIYPVRLHTQYGCDSTIAFVISKLELSTRTEQGFLCAGKSYLLPWGATVTQAGTYRYLSRYANGCDSLEWTVVLELAPSLQVSLASISDYNGYGVSCADVPDGQISLSPSQGVPPYSAIWAHGSSALTLANLPAGTYSVTVSDSRGCTGTASVTLNAPPSLTVEKDVISPLCPEEIKGQIAIHATGGVGPYLYALNQGPFKSTPVFSNLAAGAYTIWVEDANGCRATTEATIEPPLPLTLSFNPPVIPLHLGDSIQLQPVLNFTVDSVAWQGGSGYISCTDCLRPWVQPVYTSDYVLQAWSQNGCRITGRVRVVVEKGVRLYAPNAFQPGTLSENAFFRIYTGSDIVQIKRLALFDRWGTLVFEATHFPPDSPLGRWDGRIRGQEAPSGVYAWLCVVERIDGQEEIFHGDVLLVR
jgi:PKD repeat protein